MLPGYKIGKAATNMEKMKFLIMNKNINRLIEAKRVSVKMGRLYCIVDDNGRKHYALEQIPVIKK